MMALDFSAATNEYVRAALRYGGEIVLSIKDFIEKSGFEIDRLHVDNFFHKMKHDIPLYVDAGLLEYAGFSGDLVKQKGRFVETIKKISAKGKAVQGRDFWILTNDQYVQYYESRLVGANEVDLLDRAGQDGLVPANGLDIRDRGYQISLVETKADPGRDEPGQTVSTYPEPSHDKSSSAVKHVLVMPKCFKKVLMSINTQKAEEARDFYIAVEELLVCYHEYQILFYRTESAIRANRLDIIAHELRQSNAQLTASNERLADISAQLEDAEVREEVQSDNIRKIAKKLDIATDDRVVKPADRKQCETYVLFSLGHVDYPNTYYAHRVVAASANRAIARQMERFPNYREVFRIVQAPNAKIFHKNMKEYLEHYVTCRGNYITLNDGYTEEEFVADLAIVRDMKKAV